MKWIALVVILLFSSQGILGQIQEENGEPKNTMANTSIYASAAAGMLKSALLNAEFRLATSSSRSITLNHFLRVDAGAVGSFSEPDSGPAVGLAYTVLLGKRANHLELSLGSNIAKPEYNYWDSFLHPIMELGYRYQRPDGGFVFRANASGLGIGLGFGWSF